MTATRKKTIKEKNNGISQLILTDIQKLKMETGLLELKAGKGIPMKKAMAHLAKKYDLSQNLLLFLSGQ